VGRPSKLSPAQINAAFLLYQRGTFTISELAERIWIRHGFASKDAAEQSLRRFFKAKAARS
jgi:DNA-binding MarR family transcriptional regulator